MKAEIIECDRCKASTRANSREAVSYTKISVLKGGVCKEYDLCPNDADAFKQFLGNNATPEIVSTEPAEEMPTIPGAAPDQAREWDPQYGFGPRPGEVGDILS